MTESLREVARLNPDLQGVLDIKDYNERQSGQRTLDDDRLGVLIEVLSRHRLGWRMQSPMSSLASCAQCRRRGRAGCERLRWSGSKRRH